MRRSFLQRVADSSTAGLLALASFEHIERLVLRRPPVYSPVAIAGRVARRTGISLTPRSKRGLAAFLRWPYAYGLVTARELLAPRRRRSLGRALALAAAIYSAELAALPATGATPPLRRWPRRERALLFAHVMAFSLGAELGG
jgi:hypothetical protein